MANIFATLLTKAAKSGIEASRTEEAKNWFRKEASSITQINPTRLINQTPTSNKKSKKPFSFAKKFSLEKVKQPNGQLS